MLIGCCGADQAGLNSKLALAKAMKFKQGDEVEVLRRDKEAYASWFPSIISSVFVNKYSVTYKLFVSPQGKPIVETVDGNDVRPCPPLVPYKQDWLIGEVAEVLDTHSWKVARIAKIVENKYVVAKIFGSIQLKRFSIYDARVSQAWQNNSWFDMVNYRVYLYTFRPCEVLFISSCEHISYADRQSVTLDCVVCVVIFYGCTCCNFPSDQKTAETFELFDILLHFNCFVLIICSKTLSNRLKPEMKACIARSSHLMDLFM